jgi:trans-2,3-dihydro-3-hydroxyanthranilate isomerase
MNRPNLYLVDVFAQKKYTGNPLAVITNLGTVSTEEMQQIAQEMNYSETTFVNSQMQNGGYNVRIFTPTEELPFAGHPTLGTAFVIQNEMQTQRTETVCLNLKVGQIPVTWENMAGEEILWMQQNPPVFSEQFSPEKIAGVLNLSPDTIDPRFPIQEVSTGVPFIIVPLRTLAALKASKLNHQKYDDLIQTTAAKAILIFCPEAYRSESQLGVRMFGEALGVPEDPATGSANGCLAGYLAEYEYFGQASVDIRVDQGYEINRPSLLLLKAEKIPQQIQVAVGGKVIMVAKGELM